MSRDVSLAAVTLRVEGALGIGTLLTLVGGMLDAQRDPVIERVVILRLVALADAPAHGRP